jgi:hypothetical protein
MAHVSPLSIFPRVATQPANCMWQHGYRRTPLVDPIYAGLGVSTWRHRTWLGLQGALGWCSNMLLLDLALDSAGPAQVEYMEALLHAL